MQSGRPGPGPVANRRSHRRRGRSRLLLAAAASALLLVLGVGTEALARSAPAAAPDPGPAIDAVLLRWSDAVAQHDESAFLADVDTSQPALVAHRRDLFRALRSMPVSHVSWHRGGPGSYTIPGLDQRYHAPTWVAAVVFSYRLDGADVHASATAEGLTFLARGGRWVLAGESDADSELPEGGHSLPWDLEAVAVATGGSSIVVGDRADAAALPRLARQVDDAVARVRTVWPDWQHQKVVVFVPRAHQVIATYFRTDLQSVDDAAAVTVPTQAGVPEWVGGGWALEEAGQRVVLNPSYVSLDDPDLPTLLRHEIAHVATADITAPGTPTWLVEGAAEWTAYSEDPSERGFPDDVANAAADGRLLETLPGPVDFYTRSDSYDVSFLLCDYIQEQYGLAKLRALYQHLSDVRNVAFSGQAQDRAIAQVLGVSTDRLVRDVDRWAADQFSG